MARCRLVYAPADGDPVFRDVVLPERPCRGDDVHLDAVDGVGESLVDQQLLVTGVSFRQDAPPPGFLYVDVDPKLPAVHTAADLAPYGFAAGDWLFAPFAAAAVVFGAPARPAAGGGDPTTPLLPLLPKPLPDGSYRYPDGSAIHPSQMLNGRWIAFWKNGSRLTGYKVDRVEQEVGWVFKSAEEAAEALRAGDQGPASLK